MVPDTTTDTTVIWWRELTVSDASSQLVSNWSSGCHVKKKKKTLMLLIIIDDDDDDDDVDDVQAR